MPRCRKSIAWVAAILTAATTLAAPVSASPDNPCRSTAIPVCAFVPVLTDLDHDVDLTTDTVPSPDIPNDIRSPSHDPTSDR
jgi:hypothetical protein